MLILVKPIQSVRRVCDAEGGGGCTMLSPCSPYGGYIYGGSCI